MRYCYLLLCIMLASVASAWAVPSAMSFTTDAPGNGSGLFFVRSSFVSTDKYPGAVTLTVTDTANNWVTIAGANAGTESPFYIVDFNSIARATANTPYSNTVVLRWGTDITSVTAAGNDYTFVIKKSSKGASGLLLKIAYDPFGASKVFTTNYAWLDDVAPSSPIITAPIESSAVTNYVGRSAAYNVTASANYSSTTTDYSSGNTDTYKIEYYVTNRADAAWNSAATLIAQQTIASSNSSVAANFASSNVRLSYIGAITYDAAGNPTVGAVSSANLLQTKWLALGQIKDDHNSTWYGDSTYAGNWQASDNLTAGANVDLKFYAVNYYGELDATYTSLGNVDLALAASDNASVTGFDGSVPDIEIGTGNVTILNSGVTTYSGCVVLYRQQAVRLGNRHDGGTLWSVDSPLIQVKHNVVADVAYVASGSFTDSTVHSSGNGVSSKLSTLQTAYAGNVYSIRVAMVDQWNNLCLTTNFGGSANVALSGNADDPFTVASNINSYLPYGGSALNYSLSYPSASVWNVAGNAGLMDLSTTFYVEESGNVQITPSVGGVVSDNVYNNTARFSVSKASSKVVYFDNSNNYAFTGTLSGNFFTSGSSNTIYAHITDIYGNHYTSDTSTVYVTSYRSGGNNYVLPAYRNDGSTLAGANVISSNAVGGKATIANVRFDRATTSGNLTYFPYTSFALKGSVSGNTAQPYSESLSVLPVAPASYAYFANAAGEPISGANLLSTINGTNTSGNMIAGNTLSVYAAVSDLYGNVDVTTGTNLVGLVYTELSNSPSGNAPIGTGNTSTAVTGTISADPVTVIPTKQESAKHVSLQVTGMTGEVSQAFSIIAGTVTLVDFVDSTGLYSSSNLIINNTAGNTFSVYAGGLDQYYNTNTSYDSNVQLSLGSSSGNAIDISPAGNAAVYSKISAANGFSRYSVTLYDAEYGVKLKATSAAPADTTDSNAFTISANTSNNFVLNFVDSASLSNDTMKSGSTNILSSVTSGYAGNAMTFYAAELDGYGNVSGRTGANITLASHTTSASNVTLRSYNTINGGNTVTFNGSLTNAGVATFNQAFYVAETARTIKIQDVTGSANTANFSPAFSVLANTPSKTLFTESNGIWAGATGSGLTFTSGNVISSANVGVDEAINNLYVGFYDNFGNPTVTGLTGSVNIGVYNDDTGAYFSSAPSIGLSGNLSSTVVYFDPNVTTKKVTVSTGGNYMLKVSSTGLTAAGNYGRFAVQDSTKPSVTVTTPNGGEKLYAGSWPVSFTVADTVLSGSYVAYVSYDSGATWTTTGAPSGNTYSSATTTVTWTIDSSVNSDHVRIKIQVTDSTGNIAEDASDADFSISPSTKVISYVLGDTESSSVVVNFREPVYNTSGLALAGNAFSLTTVSFGSGSNVSHTAGATSATLTLSANLSSGNFNSTPAVGLTSGNVSKNSSGSSPYTTSTEIGSSAIRQIVATPYASIRSSMTSSDNQKLFGLKLTGWTNNTELTGINVQIDSVGGVVTASDFVAGSTSSANSGIALLDSAGNVVTLRSAPTISVGSTISLSLSQTLSVNALTGSDNFNYYLSLGTSSTISDVVPDSFKVSVQSVTISDATTGTNVYKVYQPYGTLTTNPIIADVTAPAAPTLTVASYINTSNVAAASLSIKGEANAVAHYTYTNGATSIGNTVTLTGNGLVTKTVTDNLSTLADGTVTVTAYLVDSLGNNGNTQGFTATDTFILDREAISSSNVVASMSNITSATKTAVNYAMTLKGVADVGATYSLIFHDASGGSSTAYTGTLGTSSNVLTLTGLDLSGLADTTTFTANVTLTDNHGNATSEFTAKTVTKDTLAPTLGALTVSDNLIGTAEVTTPTLNLSTATLSESATVYYTLTDGKGFQVTGSKAMTTSGSIASAINLTGLSEGTISIAAYAVDANGNQSATQTSSIVLRTTVAVPVLTAPILGVATSATPTLRWESDSNAASYTVIVLDSSSATAYTATSTSASNITTALAAGTYTWKVKTTDIYGNTGAYSSAETFVVKIPVLSYVVGELDGSSAIAVFDQEVFSNSNGTGALVEANFTSTLGVASVAHIAGDKYVDLGFSNALNSANINVATVSPVLVYGDGGNAAAGTGIAVRQLAAKNKVVSSSPLVYGAAAKTVASIDARGWGANGNVKLKGIDYTIVPVNGAVTSADFTGNLSVSGVAGSTTGTFGSNQTLMFTTDSDLAVSTSTSFDLQLQAAATAAVLDASKVVKVKINKVYMSVNGTSVTRMVAGTTTTSDLILSNIEMLAATSTGSSNLMFTVGQTITLGAGNVSTGASYTWTQTSGNQVDFSSSTNVLTFVPGAEGQFGFKLSYLLDGYTVDLPMSSNVTILSAASANLLGLLTSSPESFQSQADFNQGFAALQSLIGGVAGQTNLVSTSANAIVARVIASNAASTGNVVVSAAQMAALLNVVDEAIVAGVSGSTAINAGVGLLANVKSLPAVSSLQMQQTFKMLSGLYSTASSTLSDNSMFLSVSVDMVKAALKSLVDTGSKTLTGDASSAVKTVIERLYRGEVNTLSLNSGSSKLSVTMDAATLAALAGSGSADNIALYAVKLPATTITIDGSTAVVTSSIYEVSMAAFDGTAYSDVAFNIALIKANSDAGNGSGLAMTMSLNKTPAAGKVYQVVYRESLSGAWTKLNVTITQPNSTGVISFVTPHLTQFAVIEEDAVASSSSGGGGGCLLK